MSDENRGAGGSDDVIRNTTRVGTEERDEAIAMLDEHWRAGRLDPGEHELRVTRAKAAVTQADLGDLFIDLPKTGPATAPVSAGTVATAGAGGFRDSKRERVMALTPFAALVLFFTTGSWLWFLLVPVMGILLYGADRGKNAGRGRDRGRNRNRGR